MKFWNSTSGTLASAGNQATNNHSYYYYYYCKCKYMLLRGGDKNKWSVYKMAAPGCLVVISVEHGVKTKENPTQRATASWTRDKLPSVLGAISVPRVTF